MASERRADMFFQPGEDPRDIGATTLGNEKETLVEYLRYQRLTLEAKCSGLDAEQLARRAVGPSTLSLLGLVRHLAEVERGWFQQILAGLDVPRIYRTEDDPDADFNGAIGEEAVVAEAWERLHAEQAFTDRFVAGEDNLGKITEYHHGRISLREVLVHMIEEYARHNGHADLLRECIDGRLGE
ncbi:DinB family protein [Nocardioides marmorisolisilvae]|nr:DinB family protein [Nocardioides marmorisolisilvae]